MGFFSFLFGKKESAVDKAPVSMPVVEEMSAQELELLFDGIFSSEFSDFTVRKKVSASELDASAHPAAKTIDYLIYKGDIPCLAIVFVRPNNYRGMNVFGTQQICENRKISFLRFFTTMKNERTYVTERIRKTLK